MPHKFPCNVCYIGFKLIRGALSFQEMENKIRTTLNEIYFGKTKQVVNSLRSSVSLPDMTVLPNLNKELGVALQNRSQQNQLSHGGVQLQFVYRERKSIHILSIIRKKVLPRRLVIIDISRWDMAIPYLEVATASGPENVEKEAQHS